MAPIDFFNLMWGPFVFNHFIRMMSMRSLPTQLHQITSTMLAKFFGHILIISILGIRNIRDLWATEPISIHYPGKANGLPRNIFETIASHITYDLGLLCMVLIELWKEAIIPGTYLVVDET